MESLINTIFSNKKIVVITGAGISTLSGLSDFRGDDGLYKKVKYAEYNLSIECLIEEPERFYKFYLNYFIKENIKPNFIHTYLFELEKKGLIDCVITQNIDGLHQQAGSKNVIEIHGNGQKFYCGHCKKNYSIEEYVNKGYICEECNGIIRPDIILYGENIKACDRKLALEKILEADALLILGSSLTVSTIQYLLDVYIKQKDVGLNSERVFIINNKSTNYDKYGVNYRDGLEKVLKKIKYN